jgi:anti-anti-sigma factor
MDSNRGDAESVMPDRGPSQGDVLCRSKVTLLPVAGELDLATVDEFVAQVRERFVPGSRLAVDLGGVTFMSACGVGACLAVQREGREVHCDVAFTNPQGIVTRVLGVLDVEQALLGWLDQS